MIRELFSEHFPRSTTSAIELIIGIIHAIQFVNRPETAFIKRAVVGYKWQSFYQRFDFSPYIREIFGFYRVIVSQSVDSWGALCVLVGSRTNERIEVIDSDTVGYSDNTETA